MATRKTGWDRWKSAKPKERGKPVVVEDSTEAMLDEVARNVRDAAMQEIVRRLPVEKRRDWTKGQADHTLDGSSLRFDIRIENTKGKRISATMIVPVTSVVTDKHRRTAIGKQLADRMIDRILVFYRYEGTDAERKQPYDDYPAPEPTPDREPVIEQAYAKAKEDKYEKKRKKAGKLGPVCLLCGAEDRDQFPDWGDCPHTTGDEDDS